MMDRGIVFEGHDVQAKEVYGYMSKLNSSSYAADPATYMHPGHNMEKMKAGMPQGYSSMQMAERKNAMDPKFHNPTIMDHGKHRGDKA